MTSPGVAVWTPESAADMKKGQEGACGICNANPGKYKCPRCRLPYCSVACNKIHKENHPPDPGPPKMAPPSHVYVPIEGDPKPDPSNKFAALDNSKELKMLFEKYPRLLEQLIAIDEASQPPKPSISAGTFQREQDLLWKREQAIQTGKEALRKARNAPGPEGEGIREYEELVLHLITKTKTGKQGRS